MFYCKICFMLISVIVTIVAFNIDTQSPVVFEYPFSGSFVDQFAYSVLALDDGTFVIGAPNANLPKQHKNVANTGAIFQCRLAPTTLLTSCDLVNWPQNEKNVRFTNNMHLGASLVPVPDSQNQYLTCAYSYTNSFLFQNIPWLNPTGSCFLLKAKQDKPLSVIRPLTEKVNQFHKNDHYYFSHAMSGFSSTFTNNGSQLFLSTPGFDNWNGGFMEVDYGWKSKNGGVVGERYLWSNPTSSQTNDQRDNYMGYSSISGYFYAGKLPHVALGAPRQNLIGSVYIFKIGDDYSTKTKFTKVTLNGNQTGEYFGSSLLAVDLNADGFDDLLVGAPMYSLLTKHHADEGRVFVYTSDTKKLNLKTILYGSSLPMARFGTSMAKIGDVNHDNFEDVAIGAPYEDEQNGSVYIYLGSRHGINPKIYQKISAKKHLSGLNLNGFGFSFSMNSFDVDGNRFPDLLVGAYQSNKAVLLRTKPVISIDATIQLNQDYIDLKERCKFLDEIEFQHYSYAPSCVRLVYCFNTRNFNVDYQLVLDTTLWLDKNVTNERCFIQLNDLNDQPSSIARTINQQIVLRKQNAPICSDEYIVLTKDASKIDNQIDPIVFHLDFQLLPDGQKRDKFLLPMIDNMKTNIFTEVNFRLCGGIAKDCISKFKIDPVVILDDLLVQHGNNQVELVEGLFHKILVRVQVENIGQSALGAKMNITSIGSPLMLIKLDPKCKESKFTNSTSIICDLRNMFVDKDLIELSFKPFNIRNSSKVILNINITANNQIDPSGDIVKMIEFTNVKEASIDLRLDNKPEKVVFRQGANQTKFSSLIQLYRYNWSSIDSVELILFYPEGHNNDLFVNNLQIKSRANVNLKCELPKVILPGNQQNRFEVTQINGTKQFNLSCSIKHVNCKAIKCSIGPIGIKLSTVYIDIDGILNTKTIDRKFHHYGFNEILLDTVLIGKIVDKNIVNQSEIQLPVEYCFRQLIDIVPQTNIWPYIFATIVGFLILILIIIVLHWCGFFKRTKIVETEPEDQPLNTEQTK